MEAIADAAPDGTRKTLLPTLSTVPLLIIDDLGLRRRQCRSLSPQPLRRDSTTILSCLPTSRNPDPDGTRQGMD